MSLSRWTLLCLLAVAALTFIYPPFGWKRPHRHSDIPSNRS